jgi:hypothetical protein
VGDYKSVASNFLEADFWGIRARFTFPYRLSYRIV